MSCRVSEKASTAPHFKRINAAELARLWADRSIRRDDIAVMVGLCPHALTKRIKRMGLPIRGQATKTPHIKDSRMFRLMWMAGVGAEDIALHFAVVRRTVTSTAKRLGVPARSQGQKPLMTLAQFKDALLAQSMARDAAAEQRAIIGAEMADMVSDHRLVGAQKGRAA